MECAQISDIAVRWGCLGSHSDDRQVLSCCAFTSFLPPLTLLFKRTHLLIFLFQIHT